MTRIRTSLDGARQIAVLLAGIVLFAGCGRKADPRAQEAYDLVLLGKIDEAIALTNSILVDDPDNAEVRNVLGMAFYKGGDVEQSIEQYSRAIEADPELAEAHFNIGNSYKALERLEEARASFVEAVRLRKDFVLARYNLGKLHQDAGELDQAMAEYRRCVDYDPQFLYGFIDLGKMQYEAGEFDAATTNLSRALELEPGIKEIRVLLGNAYMQASMEGNLELAENEFRAAVGIDGNYADAVYSLGVVLASQNKTDEAIEWFEKVLELTTDDSLMARKVHEFFEHIGRAEPEETTAG